MSNITTRDIENEIQRHRQEIAKHRLWISQLEDTKLSMMQLAEIKAAENGHVSPFGRLPDGIEIAVTEAPRKAAALAAPPVKKERDYDREREQRNARKAALAAPRKPQAANADRINALKILAASPGPMTSAEIADKLGLPQGEFFRKSLQNRLYNMHQGGLVAKNAEHGYPGRFTLTAAGRKVLERQ